MSPLVLEMLHMLACNKVERGAQGVQSCSAQHKYSRAVHASRVAALCGARASSHQDSQDGRGSLFAFPFVTLTGLRVVKQIVCAFPLVYVAEVTLG